MPPPPPPSRQAIVTDRDPWRAWSPEPDAFRQDLDPALSMALLELRASGELEPGLSEVVTDAVLERVTHYGYDIIGQADINAILKLVRGRTALSECTDESCYAELGDVLGVERLITGSLGQFGSTTVLNLVLIDVEGPKVVRRSTMRQRGASERVFELVDPAVQQLLSSANP